MQVSLIIPALNEAAYIGQAISSIHAALRDETRIAAYEVIVVDDDSSDRTVEIAREAQAQVLQVRKRNIAAVRNAGAEKAQGDVLIFVDADTQVSRALMQEAVTAVLNQATWGTALASPAERCPLWARAGLALYNRFYVRFRKCGYGFFFFVNREAFNHVGGFPEQTREGEDMALSKLLISAYGPPTVMRNRVATSARKVHQFGFWYHMKIVWLTIRYGDQAYARPEIRSYRDGELRAACSKNTG